MSKGCIIIFGTTARICSESSSLILPLTFCFPIFLPPIASIHFWQISLINISPSFPISFILLFLSSLISSIIISPSSLISQLQITFQISSALPFLPPSPRQFYQVLSSIFPPFHHSAWINFFSEISLYFSKSLLQLQPQVAFPPFLPPLPLSQKVLPQHWAWSSQEKHFDWQQHYSYSPIFSQEQPDDTKPSQYHQIPSQKSSPPLTNRQLSFQPPSSYISYSTSPPPSHFSNYQSPQPQKTSSKPNQKPQKNKQSTQKQMI